MRLYHLPPSRSARVLWLLEEVGEPYELTVMTSDERKTGEHLRRHPLGRVPVLEDDQGFLFESAALCLQIADLHPAAQLNWPLATHERGLVYQWTVFAMSELEPAVIEVRRYREDDPGRAAAGAERFATVAAAVELTLQGHDYLVGGRFSVADLVTGAVLVFARSSGLTADLSNISAYVDRLEARPARQRAITVGV